jgi:hypothetical protein
LLLASHGREKEDHTGVNVQSAISRTELNGIIRFEYPIALLDDFENVPILPLAKA